MPFLTEVILVAVAVATGVGVGLTIAEVRQRRRASKAVVTVSSGPNERPLTVAEAEKLSVKATSGLRDSILGNIGALRREVGALNQHLASMEVLLKNALGLAARDREQLRQGQLASEDAKYRMHAEIQGLHKAIEALGKATGGIQAAMERFEKWIDP